MMMRRRGSPSLSFFFLLILIILAFIPEEWSYYLIHFPSLGGIVKVTAAPNNGGRSGGGGAGAAAEADEEDLYEVLGLAKEREEASERDVKSAWRKLSKRHHPDLAGESQREVYQRIQRAYEVLGDRRKRKVYDILGLDGVRRFEQPQGQQQQQQHPLFAFFGGGGGGGGQQASDRGRNEELLLMVPLEDLYAGAAHTVRLGRQKICRACRGTGARSPSHLLRCPHCRGEGRVVRRVQLAPGFTQQVEQACGHCGGEGAVIAAHCSACGGRRVVRGVAALSVDIEQGTPDGHTLTFEMEADQTPGQVPGDVILTVSAAPHPRFTRRGTEDLAVTVRLTLREALLGFEKELPHLDGHLVRLVETGVTQHGTRRRIAAEGMPRHHVPSERGDLHVTYEVQLPGMLTLAQREAIERALS